MAAKKPTGSSSAKKPKRGKQRSGQTAQRVERDPIGPVPLDADGNPMIEILVGASELIPTGEFANVMVGPVTVRKYIPDCDDDDLAEALNDLAEVVEVGCIATQRELVLESLQSAATED